MSNASEDLRLDLNRGCTWRMKAHSSLLLMSLVSRRRALNHSASLTVACGLWMSNCSTYPLTRAKVAKSCGEQTSSPTHFRQPARHECCSHLEAPQRCKHSDR